MTPKPINIDDLTFVLYEYDEDESQQLFEARHRGKELVGNYSYYLHQPHNPTGDYHIHLYDGNVEILSMNKGGSAHDGFHGARIPNRAFKALLTRFPDWNWPRNQILESTNYTFFCNSKFSLRPVSVSTQTDMDSPNNAIPHFNGFFHRYADAPILAGPQGYVPRTVALVENENGTVYKVRMDSIRFLDGR